MTTRPSRRLSGDTGASLALALVIVTVVALVVGTLLTFSDTSLRTTVAVRAQQSTASTADAAAQAALNTLRTGRYNNDTRPSSVSRNCFGNGATDDTLLLPNLLPGSTGSAANSAAVQCTPDPSTGADGGAVPITSANKPGNAILTLSTNPAEGLNVKALNNAIPFSVRGGIVSKSSITVTNGSLVSTTNVNADGSCSGTIVSTPPAVCNAANPSVTDPGYAVSAGTVPAYQPVPANTTANCPGKVFTFQPGFYDDAKALSDLMDGNGACKGSVWWFTPGSYYFDFRNLEQPAGLGFTGTDQWLVKDGQLVAGTPINAAGTALAKPQVPSTVPGACQNPIKSVSAVGVQFVFGGDSRLQFAGSADGEICGTYRADAPPVAFYGLRTGTATPAASTTNAGTVTGSGFTTTADTLVTALTAAGDGLGATFTSPAAGTTATLGLSPLVPAGGIPAGSVLGSAKLRIVYAASAAGTRSVSITPSSAAGAGAAVSPAVSGSVQAAGAVQTLDLTSSLAARVHDNGLTALAVDYRTKLAKDATETVDAVLLDLTWTPPAYRAETTASVAGNCLAVTYTGGSAGQCAVLSTSTSYAGKLYVQGTTYTPIAPVDITLNNITAQVLRFGVVARTLWLKETGSISFTGAVIEIPDDSPGYGPGGTVVYLTVYVCPNAGSCSATGAPSLRVRAFLNDPTGSPAPPARQVAVQSWSLVR